MIKYFESNSFFMLKYLNFYQNEVDDFISVSC